MNQARSLSEFTWRPKLPDFACLIVFLFYVSIFVLWLWKISIDYSSGYLLIDYSLYYQYNINQWYLLIGTALLVSIY